MSVMSLHKEKREAYLEHRTHETLSFPRSRTCEHLDTDTTQTPDIGFCRVSLLVVVNDWRRVKVSLVQIDYRKE